MRRRRRQEKWEQAGRNSHFPHIVLFRSFARNLEFGTKTGILIVNLVL